MSSSNIDPEKIPLAALFRHAGQPTKYKILSALDRRDQTPSELSDSLGITRSNITSQMSDLRDLGFIDYEIEGRNHRYSIRDPLPSVDHKSILERISSDQTDPDRKLKSGAPQEPEKINRKIQETKKQRLKKNLQLWVSYLDHPGLTSPNSTRQQLRDQINNLNRDLSRLRSKK
ncbi:MAG: ArsR/SmtB family transcription factor [bacterium]